MTRAQTPYLVGAFSSKVDTLLRRCQRLECADNLKQVLCCHVVVKGVKGASVRSWLVSASVPKDKGYFFAISEKKKIVCSKSYEPHALGTKSFARLADEESKLWSDLLHLKNAKLGFWICFGDFNVVREESDRKGTQFDPITTYSFNKFIDKTELQEVVMGARNFTRINKKWTKLSKLDMFLISTEVLHTWPTIHSTALPRKFSDHYPILMEWNSADFGLVPFKFFSSWLNEESINLLVQSSWVDEPGCRPDVNLYRKLKALKAKLKP
ncbi:cytochrome P450 [Tanacetum coccineum]